MRNERHVRQETPSLPHSKCVDMPCPDCCRPMTLVKAEHIMFTMNLVDLTYRCDTCKSTTVRIVKGD